MCGGVRGCVLCVCVLCCVETECHLLERRLLRFYDALKELLHASREVAIPITADRELDEPANNAEVAPREPNAFQLPPFEDLQQIFDRLMHQHKGEDGTRTFSWGDFLCALLRELGLDALDQRDKVTLNRTRGNPTHTHTQLTGDHHTIMTGVLVHVVPGGGDGRLRPLWRGGGDHSLAP